MWAAASGIVTQRGPAGGAGNLVMIKHDGGIETAVHAPLEVRADIKVGQHVAAKTVIGYVGTTGLVDGPTPTLRRQEERRIHRSDAS